MSELVSGRMCVYCVCMRVRACVCAYANMCACVCVRKRVHASVPVHMTSD